MQKSKLRSTTSLVVSFSLIASPIMAQQAAQGQGAPELCVGLESVETMNDNTEADANAEVVLPCLAADGTVIPNQAALDAVLAAQAEQSNGDAEEDTAATEDVATEEEVATDEVQADEVEAEEVVELPETEADDSALVEDTDTAETEEPAIATEEVTADEGAVEPLEEAAEAEQVPAEEAADVAVEATTEEMSDTQTGQDETAQVEAEIEADVEAESDMAETSEETDTDVVVTEGLPEGDDTDVVVTEGLPEGDDTDVVVTEGLPEGTTDTQTAEEEQPETTIVDDTAPTAAAAADAESDAESAPTGEVVVEELSDEDVRASDEDFDTAATGEAEVSAATDDDDDDRGLSNFERALLVGLGAVAVGSVLNNGDEVVSNSGDRVVVRRDNELVVLKDDDVLLRQPGSQVQTESFADGSTRTIVTREDGTQIKTIRASDGRVLRRARVFQDGSEILLFDDTQQADPIDLTRLPQMQRDAAQTNASQNDVESLRRALMDSQNAGIDRTFSLRQIRQIEQVRALAPEVALDTITFPTASAAIQPSQAEELSDLGTAISRIIEEDPGQVFLIEGHTDAVGDAGYNLALSDRRAETVALAMTEYFNIPPENLITQGYGESALKVQTLEAERANRRASIRNITSLLR